MYRTNILKGKTTRETPVTW